MMSTLTKPQM